jgi:hypothetical protein
LTTSSNLVGCSTGYRLVLAPLIILSVVGGTPDKRHRHLPRTTKVRRPPLGHGAASI